MAKMRKRALVFRSKRFIEGLGVQIARLDPPQTPPWHRIWLGRGGNYVYSFSTRRRRTSTGSEVDALRSPTVASVAPTCAQQAPLAPCRHGCVPPSTSYLIPARPEHKRLSRRHASLWRHPGTRGICLLDWPNRGEGCAHASVPTQRCEHV